MGPAEFVIVNLSNNWVAKRDFTSPPQWAIIRSLEALGSRSLPKRGLSHVVIKASASASLRMNATFVVWAEILSQLNERLKRAWWAGGKKDTNKAGLAETKSLGRMGEQFNIGKAIYACLYLLLASNLTQKTV
jgi:hypothetical protein